MSLRVKERGRYNKAVYFYALILPALFILVAMNVYPLIYSLGVSFTEYDLSNFSAEPRGVWLENYGTLFRDALYLSSLVNTGLFVVGAVAVEFLFGLIVALLLYRFSRVGRVLLAIFLLPMMLTPIIVGIMWRLLLNYDVGLVNFFIELVGFHRFPLLANPSTALMAIILVDAWQWTPFMVLLLYSGLQSLPQEPLEAARIDGASSWQTFRFVTLPALRNTIAISVLIRSMDAIREYDKIYTMTYGGPGNATETVSFYIYRQGFKFFDMGYAAAGSYILLIITIISAQVLLARLRISMRT